MEKLNVKNTSETRAAGWSLFEQTVMWSGTMDVTQRKTAKIETKWQTKYPAACHDCDQ